MNGSCGNVDVVSVLLSALGRCDQIDLEIVVVSACGGVIDTAPHGETHTVIVADVGAVAA